MHRHPTQGVKGAKPRFPDTKTNGKPTRAEVAMLSREYLEIRDRQMHGKTLTAEMVLAQERDELIEKKLVERQAAYLLISLRQRILNVPLPIVRHKAAIKAYLRKWRMGRDSNPGFRLRNTRFPSVRNRPLCHPSKCRAGT